MMAHDEIEGDFVLSTRLTCTTTYLAKATALSIIIQHRREANALPEARCVTLRRSKAQEIMTS
jgi:hypothetical protein